MLLSTAVVAAGGVDAGLLVMALPLPGRSSSDGSDVMTELLLVDLQHVQVPIDHAVATQHMTLRLIMRLIHSQVMSPCARPGLAVANSKRTASKPADQLQ